MEILIDVIIFTLISLAVMFVFTAIFVFFVALGSGGGHEGGVKNWPLPKKDAVTYTKKHYSKKEQQRSYVSSIFKSIGF